MSSPKISIIIPVYNVEKYLEICLESVVNQTYKDIEIICVNDCSTDGSLDILNCYAAKDNRISVIDKKQNGGLLAARKSGVTVASGEYLIFLDSDDYIKADLCQFIADNVVNNKFDIIQFGIEVEDYSNNSANVKWLKNALQPANKRFNGEEIIKEAYINRSYATSLVGKAFKTNICKNVYSNIPDEHCYVGEDIFTYFILSCSAQSYIGINTSGYYIYRYGLGVGNNNVMGISKFEQYCKMANWVKYAYKYLNDINGSELQYKSCEKMAQRMCEDCCKILKTRIDTEDRFTAEKIFVDYWKDISVTKSIVNSILDTTLDKMIQQIGVPVYCRYASAYDENNKPFVSVVIPVYNVEKYIRECIESVLNQTLKEIEIVCVNDGSPDNCLEIMEGYAEKDNRVTVVSRKNGGLSAARNSGIKYARGKYIYFLDSDDFITENAIEKLYCICEKDNIDVLYFGVENLYETEELKDKNKSYDNYYNRKQLFENAVTGEDLFSELIRQNMFVSSVPLQFIRLEILERSCLRFKEGILHEDELFSPQLIILADKAKIIEDKLYVRRVRESSIMTSLPSHRNFIGYFTVYVSLLGKVVTDETIGQNAKNALTVYANKIYNSSRRIYKQFSEEERKKVDVNIPQEYKLFLQPIKEHENVLQSISYKAGMLVTFVPRKLAGFIKAYKQFGLAGTIKLIRKYYNF